MFIFSLRVSETTFGKEHFLLGQEAGFACTTWSFCHSHDLRKVATTLAFIRNLIVEELTREVFGNHLTPLLDVTLAWIFLTSLLWYLGLLLQKTLLRGPQSDVRGISWFSIALCSSFRSFRFLIKPTSCGNALEPLMRLMPKVRYVTFEE